MTTEEPNWTTYADKVHDWIQEAYAHVYNSQEQMSADQGKAALVASYCLLMAHDYLEIAFFAFDKKLYHPGMACLRPVAEMAITFLWCTFLVADYVDRFPRSRPGSATCGGPGSSGHRRRTKGMRTSAAGGWTGSAYACHSARG